MAGLRLNTHTHGSQPLLLREQLALLLFGQPDVANVCTSVEQLSVVYPSGQCPRTSTRHDTQPHGLSLGRLL